MTFESISHTQLEACLAMAQRQGGLGEKVKEALNTIQHTFEQYGCDLL